MIAEIIGPSGRVHYRRPIDDPLIAEAGSCPGYSVRYVEHETVEPLSLIGAQPMPMPDFVSDAREKRARDFANQIMSMMQDYTPSDRDMVRLMYNRLYELASEHNLTILQVPLEKDDLDKLQLERAMIETHPMMILAEKTPLT